MQAQIVNIIPISISFCSRWNADAGNGVKPLAVTVGPEDAVSTLGAVVVVPEAGGGGGGGGVSVAVGVLEEETVAVADAVDVAGGSVKYGPPGFTATVP